ncbi:NAD(P)H:quinone oxidoreductase [Chitinispirillales bacterium ANBcel5]|uniref:NAD(P)H:quinone oxidoreductase n=1 Tax=Cellulosispirillum alkaliphilum TaxID=3039283 RepID=UPI002A5718FE|nr:NAD(P)H:quinone oxidoreductase [Chitinispirillales bacterium ANBcel5]
MKILIAYYTMYGHIFKMAQAAAQGAQSVPDSTVDLKRVPETLPEELLEKLGAFEARKHFRQDPVVKPTELADYDAILFGTPTRYGNMCSQMRSFLDSTGQLWAENKMVGKVASVFTSTATQHGGQESTILTFIPTLLHLGMIYVGLPYTFSQQMSIGELSGSSPYGAGTITGGSGERMPSETELAAARFQGKHVAEIAAKLSVENEVSMSNK